MFVLLDDRDATAQRPSSRLYTGFAGERRCEEPGRLDAGGTHIDADLQRGSHAIPMADYGWRARQSPGRGGEQSAALRGAPHAWLRQAVAVE